MQSKISKLQATLKDYRGVIIAFSGGVDSTLLLKLAIEVLKNNVIAVTTVSPIHSKREITSATKLARFLNCKHILVKTSELANPMFVKNTKNHCYFCKFQMYKEIKLTASRYNFQVIEGSNKSDLSGHRPGLRALKKLNIKSPFIQANITKQEIRILAKKKNLLNWNKPSMACLASRIPYGRTIDKRTLQRIEKAECYLSRFKLSQIRVRDHFPTARIEVYPPEFDIILNRRKEIARYFARLGYNYTVLDLAGYQTGSFDK